MPVLEPRGAWRSSRTTSTSAPERRRRLRRRALRGRDTAAPRPRRARASDRSFPQVPGRAAGKPRDRRHPLRDPVRRLARPAGDQDGGGHTFAQDQSTARFCDMPRAAIAAGVVDFVLAPEKIARELARVGVIHTSSRSGRGRGAAADGRDRAGSWRSCARRAGSAPTIVRDRQAAHRAAHGARPDRLDEDDLQLLRSDPADGVPLRGHPHQRTSFFRIRRSFDSLATSVRPPLLPGRDSESPIRVWVPGCATGEEVYSIAIWLFECLQRRHLVAEFGSSPPTFRRRASRRPGRALADSDSRRLRGAAKRFFSKTDRGWQSSSRSGTSASSRSRTSPRIRRSPGST